MVGDSQVKQTIPYLLHSNKLLKCSKKHIKDHLHIIDCDMVIHFADTYQYAGQPPWCVVCSPRSLGSSPTRNSCGLTQIVR